MNAHHPTYSLHLSYRFTMAFNRLKKLIQKRNQLAAQRQKLEGLYGKWYAAQQEFASANAKSGVGKVSAIRDAKAKAKAASDEIKAYLKGTVLTGNGEKGVYDTTKGTMMTKYLGKDSKIPPERRAILHQLFAGKTVSRREIEEAFGQKLDGVMVALLDPNGNLEGLPGPILDKYTLTRFNERFYTATGAKAKQTLTSQGAPSDVVAENLSTLFRHANYGPGGEDSASGKQRVEGEDTGDDDTPTEESTEEGKEESKEQDKEEGEDESKVEEDEDETKEDTKTVAEKAAADALAKALANMKKAQEINVGASGDQTEPKTVFPLEVAKASLKNRMSPSDYEKNFGDNVPLIVQRLNLVNSMESPQVNAFLKQQLPVESFEELDKQYNALTGVRAQDAENRRKAAQEKAAQDADARIAAMPRATVTTPDAPSPQYDTTTLNDGEQEFILEPAQARQAFDITAGPIGAFGQGTMGAMGAMGGGGISVKDATSMSTVTEDSEMKAIDKMPLKEVQKKIKALHEVFDGVIKAFGTNAHKSDRDKATGKNADVKQARAHLKDMMKKVRMYYQTSKSTQVGVIIPADQLVASIMRRMGGGVPSAPVAPAMPAMPAMPAASATTNPNVSPTPSASTAPNVGSVKTHPGDVLKKKGTDAFGHGFHVSVNYRNSGMEAYERRAVGRHTISHKQPEKRGKVADPVRWLNEPTLLRKVKVIPGFKG